MFTFNENGINIADQQNARSASTAVNAILQLYPTGSRAELLHRKVLVFSVSHDHHMVQIYGHYALIGKDKTTFHRHLVHSFDITAYDGKNRWTAYNFVRKLYDHFAPIHLKRIRDAVALLGPASESFISIDITGGKSEFADEQGIASVPPAQGTHIFKKPRVPVKRKWQQEIDQNHDQINHPMALVKQQTPDASSGQDKDTEIAVLQQELALEKEQKAELMEQNKQLFEMLNKG